jgi:CHAT domain-containing protein
MLAIEREVWSVVHEGSLVPWNIWLNCTRPVRTLRQLSKVRQEVVAMRTMLDGVQHWQVIDARLALAYVERLGQLTPAERRHLGEADELNGQLVALYEQGQFREGILREGGKRGLVRLDDQAPDETRRLPPYYWAAFVLSSDWR